MKPRERQEEHSLGSIHKILLGGGRVTEEMEGGEVTLKEIRGNKKQGVQEV